MADEPKEPYESKTFPKASERRGVASLCIGGGEATAVAVEML